MSEIVDSLYQRAQYNEEAGGDGSLDRKAAAALERAETALAAEQQKFQQEAQIKHMVNRFLGWKLPETFRPDAGISFKADVNENTPYPMKHEPSGTNLFDAKQAEMMVRYMIEGMP